MTVRLSCSARLLLLASALALAPACGNGECAPENSDVCGDGDETGTEECDDGNVDDGDGCDADCMLEEEPEDVCGDGDQTGDEECDDGNVDDGDGCDATCVFEAVVCDPCSSALELGDTGAICDLGYEYWSNLQGCASAVCNAECNDFVFAGAPPDEFCVPCLQSLCVSELDACANDF